MDRIRIGTSAIEASRIAFGCMRLSEEVSEARASIQGALDQGIDFFDHADIYGRGARESMFAAATADMPGLRQRIIIQTKCGIRFAGDPSPGSPQRYDFSYEHIVRSVEGSLQRLKTDYVDVLLLHRPDYLAEPAEVARAFDKLETSGKVRFFGVSNHTWHQIALLERWVDQPLVANQLLVNVLNSELMEVGVRQSRRELPRIVQGDGTLAQCQLRDITVQAWGPLVGGAASGNLPVDADEPTMAASQVVSELATDRGVSREAIVIAFLLRHPATIQPIIGTMNAERIRGCCQAPDLALTREEWYRLLVAGRGGNLP